MQNPLVGEATLDDLKAFYGEDGIGPSFKAVVATLEDKRIAVAGLAYRQGYVIVFCDLTEEARPFKHHIHRTALRILKEAKKRHRVIYAEADANEPTAEKWLSRLGFKHLDGSVWLWKCEKLDAGLASGPI